MYTYIRIHFWASTYQVCLLISDNIKLNILSREQFAKEEIGQQEYSDVRKFHVGIMQEMRPSWLPNED